MSAPSSQRFEVLDAWRGVCALLVALVHVPVAHGWQRTALFQNMQLFVDFFFVLSGFVICHAYGLRLTRERNWASFMIRRFGRVWPLHVAILGAMLMIEVLKFGVGQFVTIPLDGVPFADNRSIATLVSNLFLTQALNLHGMTSWNFPAWSIGVEFYTYAVFAAAVVLAGPRRTVYAAIAAAGLVGVLAFSKGWLFTTYDYGMYRCLYGFFIGCLVYEAHTARPARSNTTLEWSAVAVLAAFMFATGRDATSLAAPLVFACIVYVFAAEQGAVSKALKSAPAQALGLWSYSIYMVHVLVFIILKIILTPLSKIAGLGLLGVQAEAGKQWTFGEPVLDWLLIAAELGLVLMLARWTFEHIEAPYRTWFAQLADRLTQRDPARVAFDGTAVS